MERGKDFDCPRYSSLSDGEVPLINKEMETKRIVSSFFPKAGTSSCTDEETCGGIIMCFVVSSLEYCHYQHHYHQHHRRQHRSRSRWATFSVNLTLLPPTAGAIIFMSARCVPSIWPLVFTIFPSFFLSRLPSTAASVN